MLTPQQKRTIENLAVAGIKTPEQIIEYCSSKIILPRFYKKTGRHLRRHSKKYYQQIIDFYK